MLLGSALIKGACKHVCEIDPWLILSRKKIIPLFFSIFVTFNHPPPDPLIFASLTYSQYLSFLIISILFLKYLKHQKGILTQSLFKTFLSSNVVFFSTKLQTILKMFQQ